MHGKFGNDRLSCASGGRDEYSLAVFDGLARGDLETIQLKTETRPERFELRVLRSRLCCLKLIGRAQSGHESER